MSKHIEFAKLVRANWNLPVGRTLWVHYNKKWFYGFVARTCAKMCEQLGLEKQAHYLYHKNHIDKVMCMAVTGFAFEGTPENGGVGVKIGLHRCEAARIAKKRQRESRKDDEGRTCYNGPVIGEKGEAYMVDCNVTGSDEGTSDTPKYAIKRFFKDTVFPKIQELVAAGSQFEGYRVVIQGDNAGPHTDAEYVAFCNKTCNEQGWHREPQAAQMPHMNNLDLAVSPKMSKIHGNLLRLHSNTSVKPDAIWTAAQETWSNLPCVM